jgi:purine-binding chemotaxis protein CheW
MLRAALVRRGRHTGSLRRSRQQDRGPRTEYLAFLLGGDVYAAPVARIREILKPPPLTHVPRAPREILGIISVRGQLVTVVDLRRRLRLAETDSGRRSRILLADVAGGEVMGLYVDEVLQVYRLAEAEIEPAATALGGEVASYIAGIARPVLGGHVVAPVSATGDAPRHVPAGAHGVSELGKGAAEPSVIVLLDLRIVLGS